jgi:hypothetical protein
LAVAFAVVDAASAFAAAPDVWGEVADGGSVGTAHADFGTTDSAFGALVQVALWL